jgi:hypothetical protein
MKKLILVFLFIFLSTNSFSQTNISPQFSELKGMEDQLGNTHLFYRIKTSYENPPVYSWSNHIFHLDLNTGIDTLYISSSGHEDPAYNFNKWVGDVDYWNNNPAEFIYCGGHTFGPFFEGGAYITRFDGTINYFGLFWGSTNYVDISSIEDSLLYAGIITDGGPGILESTNGGGSWDTVSVLYQFLSLNPHHEDIYFVENEDRELFRTTDSGNTFNLVDPEFLVDTRFSYDDDGLHIYRNSNRKLKVSNNLGEQFSWQTKYSSDNEIFISIDESISGTIYLSDKKNIFISTDYGDNFTLYKSLDRNIVGIYKKSNSIKLYAATKNRIYEITPDTAQVIKSLPAIDDLQWYPLTIGNKWVYAYYRQPFDPPGVKEFLGFITMEVLGDTLIDSKSYSLLKNEPLYWNIDTGLVRIDSLEAKLHIYLPDENNEDLYEDFLTQAGDTTWINSTDFKVLVSEESVEVFGMNTFKRTIEYPSRFQGYELVKNVGLYQWGFSDFFAIYTRELKGCIIDGIIFGDTLTVGVEDELPVAIEFNLEQNYPNPFNPNTVIKYSIPSVGTRDRVSVQLIVYDILGKEVVTLVNEELSSGEYEIQFDATGLPSGIYFYQLKSGSYIQTKKMILLK